MEGVEIPRSNAAGVPREPRILQDLTFHPDKNLYHANPLNEDEYRQMSNLFRPVLRIMSIFGLFPSLQKRLFWPGARNVPLQSVLARSDVDLVGL